MWSYTVRPCFKISRLKWSLPRSDRAGEAAPVLRDLRWRLENLLDVGGQGEVGWDSTPGKGSSPMEGLEEARAHASHWGY